MDAAKLASLYPTMMVQNRTAFRQTILYANGDSVCVQPMATSTISSAGLLQIPSSENFELVRPTIFDLMKAKVLNLPEVNAGAPAATETAAPPAKKK